MPCLADEAFFRLFYNVSSLSTLLLLFSFFSLGVLPKFLRFIGLPFFSSRNQYDYESEWFSEEEEEEEEEVEEEEEERFFHVGSAEEDHLVADVIDGGEALFFSPKTNSQKHPSLSDEFKDFDELWIEETRREKSNKFYYHNHDPVHEEDEKQMAEKQSDDSFDDPLRYQQDDEKKEEKEILCGDLKSLVFAAVQKLEVEGKEIYGDSCTVGSTSKSSFDWRSSINCRDSATEDPFSSSSRRSCPKWESYTVFQKYDEEMMFLDRISAQKLDETESLRSIKVNPRSVSERIVDRFSSRSKKPVSTRNGNGNPYNELEAAYVAQICLTWEALNWNYKKFEKKRASRGDNDDPGCPGKIAQQFQQFQVLLQRYVENEPYEHGPRPEIYARMRRLAPKLLQVPEYQDGDDEEMKDENYGSRISSPSFLMIMEDGIRTFMNFLKADREKPFHKLLASFFKRKAKGCVDPALLQLMKQVNVKKKMKLNDLRRSRKCMRRRRRLKVEEEMEILMGLIDLKVVSRVLRMTDLSEQQLHWCEEKMSKIRVSEGKLHRDSSPLFFPPH